MNKTKCVEERTFDFRVEFKKSLRCLFLLLNEIDELSTFVLDFANEPFNFCDPFHHDFNRSFPPEQDVVGEKNQLRCCIKEGSVGGKRETSC